MGVTVAHKLIIYLEGDGQRAALQLAETGDEIRAPHRLSSRRRDILRAGGVINLQRARFRN